MEAHTERFDVVIVGAGWAGLSVSYALTQAGYSHVVYERDRICETWRRQRWASFRMNTPNVMTVLPGDTYEGSEPEGYMTRDAFVEMVESYARRHDLPVREGTAVLDARRSAGQFEIRTTSGAALADMLVVASGNLNVPRRPAVAGCIPASVNQIDGSDYQCPDAVPPGAILVIGCGNSGGQIAEDLALAGRSVFLSTGRNGRVPRTYRGRDIFLWLTDTGRMAKPRTTKSGRGLIGATHTISLQSLSALGVTLVGRLRDVSLEGRLRFDDSLADSVAFGDEMSQMLKNEIDEYIARESIAASAATPDPAESVAPRFPDPPILEIDPVRDGITTVIWSTGFVGDFAWLNVPGAVGEDGTPAQDHCISVAGVYFAGLDTLESLRAGTVLAAAEEAERIVSHIGANRRSLGTNQ